MPGCPCSTHMGQFVFLYLYSSLLHLLPSNSEKRSLENVCPYPLKDQEQKPGDTQILFNLPQGGVLHIPSKQLDTEA